MIKPINQLVDELPANNLTVSVLNTIKSIGGSNE